MPGSDVTQQSPRLTARGAATRERILAAAAELMYEHGVGSTSLDDVIDASGTGKSQLYHYFADKQALVQAVVATQARQVLAAQEPLLAGLDSVRGLERWRDAVVAANRARRGEHGCPLGSLASELSDHSEPARRELATAFEAWHAYFAAGLERMRHNGRLTSAADPDALATGLLTALQGGLLLAQTMRDTHPLQVALDMAIDQVRARQPANSHRPPRRARPAADHAESSDA